MNHYSNLPLYWINRLAALSRKELTQRFARAGHKISPEEWALLQVLWANGSGSPLSPSTMSDETIKDRTTVTRLIDGMERKGLVERRENPQDRRRSDITLTEYGAGLKPELVPHAMAIIESATRDIPAEDIAVTLRTLRAFSANLTADTPKSKPKGGSDVSL